ncbi:MAG: hypothetical protein Q7K33_00160 [Candidatus Berkelbacteria bacterium]|nr:hypothetical protein [Candidatus Berkelbacteria bacterium]
MPKTRKVFLFIALPLVIIFVAVIVWATRNRATPTRSSATDTNQEVVKTDATKTEFTAQIFDPLLISHIAPLGELNGGGSEWQATTGVMINIKPTVVTGDKMIDVFAPTAMTLESYSYHKDPRSNGNADWTLIFRVNQNITIKFDHITKAVDKIVAVTTSTPKDRSNEEAPRSKISFEAGELIAQTFGTKLAHNWNIYMTDKTVKNIFANQERYEKSQIGYRFINGACPFNYYEESINAGFIALMGATKAGQSPDCGNPSNDVPGMLSGTWFFDEQIEKTEEQLDGNFASPLSIYKDSANRVIIDLIANTQFRVEGGIDPATVSTEQCYGLANRDSGRTSGYAYFKLVSPTVMKLAYSASGSCPTSFPETNNKTYYR